MGTSEEIHCEVVLRGNASADGLETVAGLQKVEDTKTPPDQSIARNTFVKPGLDVGVVGDIDDKLAFPIRGAIHGEDEIAQEFSNSDDDLIS